MRVMRLSDMRLNGFDCIMIAGDLDNVPTDGLEQSLGVSQIANAPTRGSAILDKILNNQNVGRKYCVSSNLGRADHSSAFLKPCSSSPQPVKIVKVFET